MEGVRPGWRLDPDLRRRGGATAASWHLVLHPRGWWFPLAPADTSPPAEAVRGLRAAVEAVAVRERALQELSVPVGWSALVVPTWVVALALVAAAASTGLSGMWAGPLAATWTFVAWALGVPSAVLGTLGRMALRRRAARQAAEAARTAAVEDAHRAVDRVLQHPFVVCMPDGVAWCDPDESVRRARVVAGRAGGFADPEAEAEWAAWDRAFARVAGEVARAGQGAWVILGPDDLAMPEEARSLPGADEAVPPSGASPADVLGRSAPAIHDEGGLEGVEPIPYVL